jgi:hypothetical protein
MALHDVDYNNEQRDMAMPSNHDVASERGADGTITWSQKVNTTNKARVETKDTRIVGYDSDGKAVWVLGVIPQFNNTPVIAIAKQGIDVFTALGL